MQVSFEYFAGSTSRIQRNLSKNSFYVNNNKNGERRDFLEKFSMESWVKLTDKEKRRHKAKDCPACQGNRENNDVTTLSNEIVKTNKQKLNNALKAHNFRIVATDKKRKSKPTKIREIKEQLVKQIKINLTTNSEVDDVLSNDVSYSMYSRQRKAQCFMSKQESAALPSTRNPIANFEAYQFNKEGFLDFISNTNNINLNWQKLATDDFPVTNQKGELVTNRGHVLKKFATCHDIDVDRFNPGKSISGRDFRQRTRRRKKKLLGRHTVPVPKTIRQVKEDIQEKISSNEILLGREISGKLLSSTKVDNEGGLTTKREIVFARDKGILPILRKEMARLNNSGILRIHPDSYYEDDENVKLELQRLQDTKINNTEDLRKAQRTIHFKIWHDHASLLGSSHVALMIQVPGKIVCFRFYVLF